MENKFTLEQIEKAKKCKTVDELIALAKENGIELTEAEATNLFAMLNPENGGIADSELESVSAGCSSNKLKNVMARDHCMRTYDFDSWFEQSDAK